ncbi:hypothetical protein BVX97_03650 [bacterium E08(2017)]|nr:hypothetical protein BVX97_03650 [bacterium E08(2017)]
MLVKDPTDQLVQTYAREFKTTAGENQLYQALIQATHDSGATVFKTDRYDFHPQGMTAFAILGESHSALHTFPEKETVWVEIATCADTIDVELFFSRFEELIR